MKAFESILIHAAILRCVSTSCASVLLSSLLHASAGPVQEDVQLRLAIPIDVVAVRVKDGVKETFVAKGTPVFLIGPLDNPNPEIKVAHVDSSGRIKGIDLQPDKDYRLFVDTLKENQELPEVYFPIVLSLRVSNLRFATQVTAESLAIGDFRVIGDAQAEFARAASILKLAGLGKPPKELQDAAAKLEQLTQRIQKDFQIIKQNGLDEWRGIPLTQDHDKKKNTVLVSGMAGLPKQEQGQAAKTWSPYPASLVFATTADGEDLTYKLNGGPVFTDQDGRFSLILPKDVCMTVIVDAEYHVRSRQILKPPSMIRVCVTADYDTQVTVNEGDEHLSEEERCAAFSEVLEAAILNSTNKDHQKQLRKAMTRFRSAMAKASRVNLVSCLYGSTPGEDWERVSEAARRSATTVYWVVANLGKEGFVPKWEESFEPYIEQQFTRSTIETSRTNMPRSNFRIVGYVSCWTGTAAKLKATILREIEMWVGGAEQRVTGVFVDNLWRVPDADRQFIYKELKSTYGDDFAVFGACGELENQPEQTDAESEVSKNLDTIFLDKDTNIDFREMRRRQKAVADTIPSIEGKPSANIGVFNVGVHVDDWAKVLGSNTEASVRFLNITDFSPSTIEEKWFDASLPLPTYWDDLYEEIDFGNSTIGIE